LDNILYIVLVLDRLNIIYYKGLKENRLVWFYFIIVLFKKAFKHWFTIGYIIWNLLLLLNCLDLMDLLRLDLLMCLLPIRMRLCSLLSLFWIWLRSAVPSLWMNLQSCGNVWRCFNKSTFTKVEPKLKPNLFIIYYHKCIIMQYNLDLNFWSILYFLAFVLAPPL